MLGSAPLRALGLAAAALCPPYAPPGAVAGTGAGVSVLAGAGAGVGVSVEAAAAAAGVSQVGGSGQLLLRVSPAALLLCLLSSVEGLLADPLAGVRQVLTLRRPAPLLLPPSMRPPARSAAPAAGPAGARGGGGAGAKGRGCGGEVEEPFLRAGLLSFCCLLQGLELRQEAQDKQMRQVCVCMCVCGRGEVGRGGRKGAPPVSCLLHMMVLLSYPPSPRCFCCAAAAAPGGTGAPAAARPPAAAAGPAAPERGAQTAAALQGPALASQRAGVVVGGGGVLP